MSLEDPSTLLLVSWKGGNLREMDSQFVICLMPKKGSGDEVCQNFQSPEDMLTFYLDQLYYVADDVGVVVNASS